MTDDRKYWLIAVGKESFFWDYCKKDNFIVIGWSDLTDLDKVQSLDELKKIYIDSGWGTAHQAGANCPQIWNFSRKMKIGDIVLVREGQKKLLGIGEITSRYYRDAAKIPLSLKNEYGIKYDSNMSDSDFSDIRDVKWFKNFPDEGIDVPMQQDWLKTIQDISKEKVDSLLNETGQENVLIEFGSDSEINLLMKKKQIILYGPPGTGKTYNTKNIAVQVIRNG
jgi:5-methylcytosine-specific restriction protein B